MIEDRCRRCGGPWLRATDEHGDPDTHCMACGERLHKPHPARLAALDTELNKEARVRGMRLRKPGGH